MSNADDPMDKPVTHRQMQDMFANFLDAIMARIDERFTQQFALQDARIDARFNKAFAEQEARIVQRFAVTEARLTRELREQLGAIDQDHLDDLRKSDDKYKDLPERVTKLEAVVYAPKRRRGR